MPNSPLPSTAKLRLTSNCAVKAPRPCQRRGATWATRSACWPASVAEQSLATSAASTRAASTNGRPWRSVCASSLRCRHFARHCSAPATRSCLSTTKFKVRESLNAVRGVTVAGRDAFWSDDLVGSGQNRLGRLLMLLREELRPGSWPAYLVARACVCAHLNPRADRRQLAGSAHSSVRGAWQFVRAVSAHSARRRWHRSRWRGEATRFATLVCPTARRSPIVATHRAWWAWKMPSSI